MGLNRNKEELEKAARESFSIAVMCRYFDLKPCGGNYRIMHTAIEKYNIDTSHFRGQGWNVGLHFKPFEQRQQTRKSPTSLLKLSCTNRQLSWTKYQIALSSDNRLAVGVDQRSQASAISGSDHEVVYSCFLVDDYEGIGHQTVSLRFLKFKSFIHSILPM